MSENPSYTQQSQSQSTYNQNNHNLDNPMKILQAGIKTNRLSKINFKLDEGKELIRSAKSGSVKAKLNIENTKLRINVQNLSSAITAHKKNQAKAKMQVERYKQKIGKYKSKIKEKDSIIIKLLDKIERKIHMDGIILENQLINMHEQQLQNYKQQAHKNEKVDEQDILKSYQDLLKGWTDQQKSRKYLHKQKQQVQKTVKDLKQVIKSTVDEQGEKRKKKMVVLKQKLKQTQALVQREKLARDILLELLQNSNVQVTPQLKTVIEEIDKDGMNLATKKQEIEEKDMPNSLLSDQIENLKQKLRGTQLNLMKQQQLAKSHQKRLLDFEDQYLKLGNKITKFNFELERVQKELPQIENKYQKDLQSLQQKIKGIETDSDELQKHKAQVEEISKDFNKFIEYFTQQTANWSALQTQYREKLTAAQLRKKQAQEKYEQEKSKRRIFELKLISQDQNRSIDSIQENKPEEREIYLAQRFDILKQQSIKNKKENKNLNEEIQRSKRAYELLQQQLNEAQEKIFKFQQLLKKKNISSQELNQISPKHSPLKVDKRQEISNEQIRENVIKETSNMGVQELKEKIIEMQLHNGFLQSELNQLRAKNIDIRLNYEDVKKEVDMKDTQNQELKEKIKKKDSSLSNKIAGLTGQGKVLQKGQTYVQKTDIEGEYQVNIINVNDISTQIQKMTFEELATKYEAARDQLAYLKQKIEQMQKINQTKNVQNESQTQSQPQYQSILPKRQVMVEQNQPFEEDSQQIDEAVYKNINEQMDRLLAKTKALQKQLQEQKREHRSEINMYEALTKQLKQKLKSGQEINENLSNIVVHLEGELSRYQNLDISGEKENDIMVQGVKKPDEIVIENDQTKFIQKELLFKRKKYEDLTKNIQKQSNQNEQQISKHKATLANLEQEIKSLQQKLQQQTETKQKSSLLIDSRKKDQKCVNCQSLRKINGDLVRKLSKNQQAKENKNSVLKKQLQAIEKQYKANTTSTPLDYNQLAIQNRKLKELLAQVRAQIDFDKDEEQKRENQLNNLKEINQQLIASLHDKQKMLLKAKTQAYRLNLNDTEDGNESRRKLDAILGQYEKKIEQLEERLRDQDKNEASITDLYDTINYLNNQCEVLKKQLQISHKESSNKQMIKIPQNIKQVPQSQQQLQQKYEQLANYITKQLQILSQYNYKDINEMLTNLHEMKQQNESLMKDNKKLKENIERMEQEKQVMYEENEKIAKDLKNIQANVQKLTRENISSVNTTINTDKNQTKANIEQIRPKEDRFQQEIPQKSNQNTSETSTLEKIRKKLQTMKEEIQKSSYKTRPNFQIYSFKQLPILQDTVKLLFERLTNLWDLVQQRTNQFNQLRDEMKIISMQCMKTGQIDPQVDKSDEMQNKEKKQDILEERYEEVLAELIQYENQNRRLQKQVNRLKHQISGYKKQMEEVQTKYVNELKSESSQQLPYNEHLLDRLLESGVTKVTSLEQNQIPEIIKLFLARIKDLQSHLEIIEGQFDQKNQRLQSLIQKQKSFISEKEKLKKEDQSVCSVTRKQAATDREMVEIRPKGVSLLVSGSLLTPNLIQQKSYQLNSAKVFRQIEQLTKINQELKDKKQRYQILLNNISKSLQQVLKIASGQLEDKLKRQLQSFVNLIAKEFEQDSRRDNSGFDLQNDIILSSSFAQKVDHNKKSPTQGLEQINKTLQGEKNQQGTEKAKKNEEENEKKFERNMKFLDENKFLLQQLVQKVNKQIKNQENIEEIKRKIALKLADKEIQQILYLTDSEKAAIKILTLIGAESVQSQKKQGGKKTEELANFKLQQSESRSLEQGQWVETEQLQAIINQIYPIKSELCMIVTSSINMLMIAQTKQGILKAVEFLFSNLKRKQNEIKQQMKRREENVAEYGRKLQKLLTSKYSQEQSRDKNDLLYENSFRKSPKEMRENESSSNSQSGSGVIENSQK